MASGIPIQSGSTGNLANVDANGNLYTNGPTIIAQAGYEAIAAVVSDGITYPSNAPRTVRRIESSDANRMFTATCVPMFLGTFAGTAIDLSLWNQSTSTMTITVAGGFLNLDANATTTASTYAIAKTYRTFPIFQDVGLRFESAIQFSQVPQTNTVMEWGLGLMATNATPTDGAFFRINGNGDFLAVTNFNGTENYVDLGFVAAAGTRYDTTIVVNANNAYFYINNNLAASIAVTAAGSSTTAAYEQPVSFRIYNTSSVPSYANIMKIGAVAVTLLDGGASRTWAHSMVGAGGNAIQNTLGGGTTGQTANYVNSTAPASATLSNTAGGYTTLGGQWQFATVAGAETDYALFAFLNPAATAAVPGRALYVTGIRIDSLNTGAAVATSSTILQWGCSAGATAATLVGTVDSAGAKIVRRVTLGLQSFAIGAAIGASPLPGPIDTQFASPMVVNAGEYFHVIVKSPIGTATTSQIIRGTCFINGYFE
jgi:hypothetical protein